MKLECVLTGVNENILYIDFIPLFIKQWKKLYPNIDIKIILISDNIPEKFIEYLDNIILFKPIDGISTVFISQYIRILYPAILNYQNGVLITDIDMIPMNNKYFTENIESIEEDKFIYYRENVCFNTRQIAMCYNIAKPKIWSDIFEINTIKDIEDRLIKIGKNPQWCSDQLDLYNYVFKWNKDTNNLVCLKENDTKFKRLDRHGITLNNDIINNIKSGLYTDYHCLRPFKDYEEINNKIYELS